MALGSLFLFQCGTAPLSRRLIVGATLATALFFLFIVGAGLRAQKRKVTTGQQGLIGGHGVVVERLAPVGLVRLGGEVWSAVGEAEAEIGTEVEIMGVTGLTLRVRPLAKEAQI